MNSTTSPLIRTPETLSTALAADNFRQTVDRALIHRAALGEVFLTDVAQLTDTEYIAASQLPRSHAYYGDHTQYVTSYDPVLLLEASRQAALAIAHRFFAVPAAHKFILTKLNVRIDQPAALRIGLRPGELVARVRITDKRVRDGQVAGLDYHLELSELSTGSIGSIDVGLRFRSPDSYLDLRSRNRGDAPLPSSATFRPALTEPAAEPATVGRRDPRNVIITTPTPVDGVVVAEMQLPTTHPSMFDHPQDHVPGMVLIEAARQLAIAAVTERHSFAPTKLQVRSITSEFVKFAELEPATRLIAMVGAGNATGAGAAAAPGKVTVYTQAGPLEVEPDPGPAEYRTAGHGTGEHRTLPVVVEQFQDGDLVCRVTTTLSVVSGTASSATSSATSRMSPSTSPSTTPSTIRGS